MDKTFNTRAETIVSLSKLLENYFFFGGNVSKAQIRRITAFRQPLAQMQDDARLAPVAAKFLEVIEFVEKDNIIIAAILAEQALELGEDVIY